jgi:hypothetical protein
MEWSMTSQASGYDVKDLFRWAAVADAVSFVVARTQVVAFFGHVFQPIGNW